MDAPDILAKLLDENPLLMQETFQVIEMYNSPIKSGHVRRPALIVLSEAFADHVVSAVLKGMITGQTDVEVVEQITRDMYHLINCIVEHHINIGPLTEEICPVNHEEDDNE